MEKYLQKSDKIILLCRSGDREGAAAQKLESIGFLNVYTIDNYLKVQENNIGGEGGF